MIIFNILHRATYAAIRELQPLYDLLAFRVDCEALFDIGSYNISENGIVSPFVTTLTVPEFFSTISSVQIMWC